MTDLTDEKRIPSVRTRVAIVSAMLVISALALYFLSTQRRERLRVGDSLRPMVVRALSGTKQILDPSAGQAVHAWLFVRPSCAICLEELRDLEASLGRARGIDLTIIVSGTEASAKAVISAKIATRTRVVVDDEGRFDGTYGRFRVPTLLLLDKRGRILRKVVGRSADLTAALSPASRGAV